MLKKISAFLLTAVTVFAFASCGGGEQGTADKKLTAAEIYKKAVEKQETAETVDMDMNYVINMSSGGESYAINMDMKMKTDLSDKNNIKMGMSSKVNMPELGETAVNYAYIDNTIYVETAGVKYKSAVSAADAEKIMGSASANEMFDLKILSDAKLTKEGTDNIITFNIDKTAFQDIMSDSMGEFAGAGVSYDFSDLSATVVVDKDYNMKSMKISVKASYSAEGTEMSMDMAIDAKINSVGKPVSISAPADAESYTEVSPETLTQSAA